MERVELKDRVDVLLPFYFCTVLLFPLSYDRSSKGQPEPLSYSCSNSTEHIPENEDLHLRCYPPQLSALELNIVPQCDRPPVEFAEMCLQRAWQYLQIKRTALIRVYRQMLLNVAFIMHAPMAK